MTTSKASSGKQSDSPDLLSEFSRYSVALGLKFFISAIIISFVKSKLSSSFERYPLQVRHKQNWGWGFILLLPQTAVLYCLDQMLAVMSLSQHRVSSSKTVRPRAPCGARCIGHTVSTWSAVCSESPHSQFGKGARPHLCMDEWNRPTPARMRLSLTQAAPSKPIPTGLAPVSGAKARSLEAFSQYSVFHLWFVHSKARMPSLARLSKRFRAAGTNGRLDLSLAWRVSEDPLKRPYKIWSGSRDPRWPRRVSLPFGEAQLAGCLRIQVGGPLEWDAGIQ